MSFEYQNDCIHLKACRRVQAIGRKHRLMVPRYCTEECTAYIGEDEITKELDDAITWAFEHGRDNDYIQADYSKFIDMLKGGDAK